MHTVSLMILREMQKEAMKMAKVGGLQKIYMFKEPNQKHCLYVKVIILYQAVYGIIIKFNVVIDYGRLSRKNLRDKNKRQL